MGNCCQSSTFKDQPADRVKLYDALWSSDETTNILEDLSDLDTTVSRFMILPSAPKTKDSSFTTLELKEIKLQIHD